MSMPFVGNLTAQPQLMTAGEGQVARLRVACNDRYRDVNGEWQKGATVFHNVEVWGQAGIEAATWPKGTPVVGVGEWRANEYEHENKETNAKEKRRFQYLKATAIGRVAGVKSKGGSTAGGPTAPPAAAAPAVPATPAAAPAPEPEDDLWSEAKA